MEQLIPCGDCGCSARVVWTESEAVITEPGLDGVEYICRAQACACHTSPHEGCVIVPPWVCREPACPRSVAPAPA